MRKILASVLLVTLLMLTWGIPAAACGNNQGGSGNGNSGQYEVENWAASFYYQIGSGTVTAQLVTADEVRVGTVKVWEADGTVKIRFETFDWTLLSTALHIGRASTTAKAEKKIPRDNQGNYTPQDFDQQTSHDPVVSLYQYSVDEAALGRGSWLCLAAWALVQNADQSEINEAWGDMLPVGAWLLPKNPVTVALLGIPGSGFHYMDLELSEVGEGYCIQDGVYSGWCADSTRILDGDPHPARVYSSLKLKRAPGYISAIPWDKINYILNHFDPDGEVYTTIENVQLAIWYYTNGETAQTAGSQALIEAAEAGGAGFTPQPGQIAALILDQGNDLQLTFIELLVPTTCFKEQNCRHDCDSNWSPCGNNWEPQGNCGTNSWQPCSNHSSSHSQWNGNNNGSACTAGQQLNNCGACH